MPSQINVPNNDRIILIVKLRCHFIGFYEGGKFWDATQKGIPIKKRLARTEIKTPLHWIDYPQEIEPCKTLKDIIDREG